MKKILISFYFSFMLSFLFAQNVGIGIAHPTLARLQVNGAGGIGNTTVIFGSDGTGISFQQNWPTVGFNQYRDNKAGNGRYIANGYAAIQFLDPGTGYMYFDMFPSGATNALTTAGTRSLTISNTGNIGIKTGPANAPLYAVKAGNYDGAAVFGGSIYNSHFSYGNEEHTYIRGGLYNSKVYINENNAGNILLGGGTSFAGINTGAPLATLDIRQVSKRGYIIIDPDHGFQTWDFRVGYYVNTPESDLKLYYNEALVGYFSVQGFYTYITSDRRIKTNIKPLVSVLDKLKLLQPKEYEMKDFNKDHESTFGFIAQEINEIYPEFVRIKNITVDSANHIPDLHGLNYDGFDMIAIKALQEQYEQLKNLERENIVLLKRLEEMETKMTLPGR